MVLELLGRLEVVGLGSVCMWRVAAARPKRFQGPQSNPDRVPISLKMHTSTRKRFYRPSKDVYAACTACCWRVWSLLSFNVQSHLADFYLSVIKSQSSSHSCLTPSINQSEIETEHWYKGGTCPFTVGAYNFTVVYIRIQKKLYRLN